MPEDTPLPPKKFWAFISYSSLDRKWGQWLHRRLENYPIPREFRGTEIFDGAVLSKNLRPVFRDRDELAGSANLGPAILKGLQDSRFLIVLCSPNSAQSKWVNKEIEDFIAISGEENILALILSGEPNASSDTSPVNSVLECFPPALRYPVEPLAGDLRKEGDGKQRGFLKILAGISQLDFDILYRRHERAQRNRRIVWSSIAALIIAALTGLSIFSVKKTREQSALLDNVALADHDSALQAFELGQYRESAAYYARSLSIRPNNNTTTPSTPPTSSGTSPINAENSPPTSSPTPPPRFTNSSRPGPDGARTGSIISRPCSNGNSPTPSREHDPPSPKISFPTRSAKASSPPRWPRPTNSIASPLGIR